MDCFCLPEMNVGIGIGNPLIDESAGLGAYINQMAFWSDEFDFGINKLLDKSGNSNDVPLLAGNCVNFINDVTITLYEPRIGANITELNKSSSDLAGVTVNGSGHIDITQASLTDPKIYHIQLDTGEDLYLTGGANNWVFCKESFWGRIGGTIDVDWEHSTQDDYFGNLERGFTLGGNLQLGFPTDMEDWTYRAGFTVPDASTVLYTGAASQPFTSLCYYNGLLEAGSVNKIKITVWDSTEDFGSTGPTGGFQINYAVSPITYFDDDGVLLTMNGVHYLTDDYPGAVNRVSFGFADTGIDQSGKTFKFRCEWVRLVDETVKVPLYSGAVDAVGNAIGSPAIADSHNDCEVQLDFSGILGVKEAGGGDWAGPANYMAGDSVTNPMFKRYQYNDNLYEKENDYIVFDEFIDSEMLSDVVDLLEEPHMLVKYFPDEGQQPILVIQKYDSTRDVVTMFAKVGYNELYTYAQQSVVNNSKQLPVGITLASLYPTNTYTDRVGPYNINSLGWAGGAHVAPSSDTPQADWEEITAKDDPNDQITIVDRTDFPDPIAGRNRLIEGKVYDGPNYSNAVRCKYTSVVGTVLQLSDLYQPGSVDLSAIVIGGGNPSQAEYAFQTAIQIYRVRSIEALEWTPVKRFSLDVINHLIDYTTIVKSTLVGDPIIEEVVSYIISQKAPTVFIEYNAEFIEAETVNIYYGIQGPQIAAGGNARMYLAHSDNQTVRTISGVTSGVRATYPCEKVIHLTDYTDNDASENIMSWMNLDFGTPDSGDSALPYWNTAAKNYFSNIDAIAKIIGDKVTWKGGYSTFKNLSSTQYVFAYFHWEEEELYFIVDFSDSLTFGSINEVLTAISGRDVETVYKDGGIAIADTPATLFTVPNTGLDLTATAAGNIKLKLT